MGSQVCLRPLRGDGDRCTIAQYGGLRTSSAKAVFTLGKFCLYNNAQRSGPQFS
jgi:hypothetical protein